jgi:hypothetical protein
MPIYSRIFQSCHSSHKYKAATYWSMAKCKWRASCKLMMKNLQNTCHSDLIIYKSYATYVYQAQEASGGFLIIYQLQ